MSEKISTTSTANHPGFQSGRRKATPEEALAFSTPLKGVGVLLAAQYAVLATLVVTAAKPLVLAAAVATVVAQVAYRHQMRTAASANATLTHAARVDLRAGVLHLAALAVAAVWPRAGAVALALLGVPSVAMVWILSAVRRAATRAAGR